MRIKVTVYVEVEHVSGKFAPRDEVEDAVADAIERAEVSDISGVGADGASEYAITEWGVAVVDPDDD